MRFQILRSGGFSWLLRLFGASAAKSFVAVTPSGLHVRFGPFAQDIPRAEVQAVSLHAETVPWFRTGIGWRTDLMGKVALIGAPRNVVRIELNPERKVWLMGIRVTMRELFISLEEPQRFIEATALKA
jgi:hypothetical protein